MRKLSLVLLALTLMAAGLVACGDSVRNSQGTSFSFLGWYQPPVDEDGNVDPEGEPERVLGLYYSLDNPEVDFVAFAGVQNHLYGEAIRVQRVHFEYEIVGSTMQIPSTDVAVNVFLGPNPDNSNGAFDQDSTLPDSFEEEGEDFAQKNYLQIPMLSAPIKNFLSLNRDSLPQRPLILIVRAYASGITTAGRTIHTNEFDFELIVLDGGVSGDAGNDTVAESTDETEGTAEIDDTANISENSEDDSIEDASEVID